MIEIPCIVMGGTDPASALVWPRAAPNSSPCGLPFSRIPRKRLRSLPKSTRFLTKKRHGLRVDIALMPILTRHLRLSLHRAAAFAAVLAHGASAQTVDNL
jgi:hypothetical protein